MRRSTSLSAVDRHRPSGRSFAQRLRSWAAEPERGDVPGWVLITIMTAGLVAALWLVAEPLLTGLFTSAVSSVGG
ncbi:hypothetical protein [Ornithinimicrobium pekingense]|uniref:Uncharacterized protein n=1 Tax=Ornithinimicrobium pekingense TaxID=384677 RepID=A0ABQ2F6K4_9MICO|nr:hypothetical protein [Ornithinimicrobium pekingense]GGK63990.1 hypothetical protein GCM10011509_10510 [Ornithinimicrobium pekingense]